MTDELPEVPEDDGRFAEIHAAIANYIDQAKAKARDGLTWVEFGELLVSLLRLACRLVDLLQVSGAAKKAIVLQGVASLFDAVADFCVPIWALPVWVLARTPVRALVLALASGAVEALLPLVRIAA